MHRVFCKCLTIMVSIATLLCAVGVSACSTDKEIDKSIQSLEIGVVNFYMTTIVNVRCDEFASKFAGEMKTYFVYDKAEIKRFESIFNNLRPSSGEQPDTRARVLIHYKNGQVDILCISLAGISLNGEMMQPAGEVVRFVEDIQQRINVNK